MKIEITRSEPSTGGPNRTKREEMAPLFDGPEAEVEPEQYVDVSPSEAWPWDSNPQMCTWLVQIPSVKGVTEPFALLDSQAAAERARAGADAAQAAGGVATYPFSNVYLPLSDQRDDEGDLIIDLNPDNFDQRWAHFLSMYTPRYFENGMPAHGGTMIMSAVEAGDEHFMDELGSRPRAARPKRARMVHTDGLLKDADKFRRYLEQAKPVTDLNASTRTPLGSHGEWDEAWLIAIYGEEGGEGRAAYRQYSELAKDHPWIHLVYFENVVNGAEASEDIAYLAVPTAA
jgi:hypothetical protein